MTTWWDQPTWHEYERLCGDAPGTRSRLLAESDWSSRVVDLSLSEAELWKGVRRSYKSLIHRDEDGVVVAHPYEISGWGRAVHDRVVGRETRPAATWDLMKQWMVQGYGLATMDVSGYVYAVRFGAWAYYFSSAATEPNMHAMIWRLLQECKAEGVRWFEMGWQGEAHDDKGRNIEMFRRGFGGYDIPAKEAPELCGL